MFNLRSSQQISDFLFNYLKLKPIKLTEKKKASVDESVIINYAEKENVEFCKLLLEYRKLEKAKGTYLADIKRWMQTTKRFDNLVVLLHPDFWLNTTETCRSSSSNPNQQNQPKHGDIREGLPWKVLREIYISLQDKNWCLGEVDYEGAEVKTVANISMDYQLIEDLNNNLDMHSHWTNVIFGWDYDLPYIKKNFEEERHIVKNNWTFANIYLAGAESIAREFRKFDVYKKFVRDIYNKLPKKTQPFFDFFESFSVRHISDCQDVFFGRYSRLKQWQKEYIDFYYRNGYIETPLGFRRNHPLTPNEIVNFPIQATSFHILLHSLIRVQKELLKNDFKSYPIAQIHDSGLFMLWKPEAHEFFELVDDLMINHELPIAKEAALGTEWSIGRDWLNMKTI